MRHTLSELTGPVYGHETVRENDHDLTIQQKGEPLGERIIVHGHVLDEDGRGVPNTLVEIWQANACGRYIHVVDQHPPRSIRISPAPAGRKPTPGLLQVRHHQARRLPLGQSPQRLASCPHPFLGIRPFLRLAPGDPDVFPGDPLFPFDPIFNSVTDERARNRMISSFDLENTQPEWALCYRFDIILRGRERHADGDQIVQDNAKGITPSQTVGPYFKYGLTPNGEYAWNDAFTNNLVTPDVSGERIRVEGKVYDGDGASVPDCMLEIWQADAQGRFSDPQDTRALPNTAFKGFGRCGTDASGGYSFDTIKPGPVPDPDGKPQAPHSCSRCSRAACCCISTPGSISTARRPTRSDPVLALVPADRRATLIAKRKAGNGQCGLHARHPPAGRQRDGVFRRVRFPKRISFVMPGLVPASTFFAPQREDVDGRVKPGHDAVRSDFLYSITAARSAGHRGPAEAFACGTRPVG